MLNCLKGRGKGEIGSWKFEEAERLMTDVRRLKLEVKSLKLGVLKKIQLKQKCFPLAKQPKQQLSNPILSIKKKSLLPDVSQCSIIICP